MKVQIIEAFLTRGVGEIVEIEDISIARDLIKKGLAKEVKAEVKEAKAEVKTKEEKHVKKSK